MTDTPDSGVVIDCAGTPLDLSQPQVMGILNITPDSFSDGGQFLHSGGLDTDTLCRRAEAMAFAGARILDIGGESTRPGAEPVSEQEELDRVLGALAVLRSRVDAIYSIDTSSPTVMQQSAALGAGMINDVRALSRPEAIATVADLGLPVCLMHMRGDPATMQQAPTYTDVVEEVRAFFQERLRLCIDGGIEKGNILLDPGFGFGKSVGHNFELLRRLSDLAEEGLPLLVGLSRKSMIAGVIDRAVDKRMPASVALALMAVYRGARIVRVHDVAETVDALAMWSTVEQR